jgi:hypothetical protein
MKETAWASNLPPENGEIVSNLAGDSLVEVFYGRTSKPITSIIPIAIVSTAAIPR